MVKLALQAQRDVDHLSWASRAAALLAYAHWEGFVKAASARYLTFVCKQNLPTKSLKVSLQAASCLSHFRRVQNSSKLSHLGKIIAEIDIGRNEIFSVDPKKIIDTESNLSSTVFADIVAGLGLEYLDEYQTRKQFIDEKLVHARNKVAHGELLLVRKEEAVERIDAVVKLLDRYSSQLIDAVRDEAFLDDRQYQLPVL